MTIHPQQIDMSGATYQQKLYDQSIELLRIACPTEGYYLATSFGKDSIVTQRLCDEAGVKYDAHHNITGIDPPPLVQFGRKYYPRPDVERLYSGTSMWRLIVEKGIPPMRHKRYCCQVLKEDAGRGRVCVMGMRAEESTRRAKQWAFGTELGGDRQRMFDSDDIVRQVQSCTLRGGLVISPLYLWPSNILWDFIYDRRLPFSGLYTIGFDRLGCVGCPMASREEREYQFALWPEFRAAYVRSFQRLLDSGRFTKRGFRSGEEVMQWWLEDKVQEKSIEGQVEFEI